MFVRFDEENLESLNLQQFKRYLYAIGMEFITIDFNSGVGVLFNTKEEPEKSRVQFEEFMNYINDMSSFKYSDQDYQGAMEILDQDGEGLESNIEDIERVLGKYSEMTPEEINSYIDMNVGTQKVDLDTMILQRMNANAPKDNKDALNDTADRPKKIDI